jgi:hypothetical protein
LTRRDFHTGEEMAEIHRLEENWGESNFGKAELGDVRRTRALVSLGNQIATHPGHSLPTQVENPAAYESMLGLVKANAVTHSSVAKTHFERTCSRARLYKGTVLFAHDGSEADFTSHKSLKKLGQIGDGKGRGYECHNSLAIAADTGEVLGLANQILHTRAKVPPKESVAAKRERTDRESLLWLKGCQTVADRCDAAGPAAEGHREVHLFDRGGDTFENLETQTVAGRIFVCRSNYNRTIYIGHDTQEQEGYLHDHVRTLTPQDWQTIDLPAQEARPAQNNKPARPARPARQARLAVSFAAVQVKAPHVKRGKHGNDPLKLWVVRLWEDEASEGTEPLEWILLTPHPIKTAEDGWLVMTWYRRRWTVEDFHKAQKTGCKMEKMQFRSEERLEPMIALVSVVATLLLQLRWLSRQEGLQETPAVEVVPAAYVGVMSVELHGERRLDLSAAAFFIGLAQLGGYGYANQKRPPGWLVLWRGWAHLHSKLRYALAIHAESLDPTDPLAQADFAAIPELSASLLDFI